MSNQSINSNPTCDTPDSDDFFVGYQSISVRRKRMLRLFFLGSGCGMAFIALLLASRQKDPGSGVWEEGQSATLIGVVSIDPYPLIRVPAGPSGESALTFLIVSSGKFGARDRLRPYDGQALEVKGTILHRDDRWMLELGEETESIRSARLDANAQPLPAAHIQSAGAIRLRGEIIDPKCYIGAMKPGGGKTHKACAQLCIGGGIPPMLVTRDDCMRETFYLLVASNGGELNASVLPYVGDPVEVSGQLERRGDLWVVRLGSHGIERL